jgi:hypothetical protein
MDPGAVQRQEPSLGAMKKAGSGGGAAG